MTLPRLIALCGYPQSGKSTVQALLQQHYQYAPVDDGRVIRDTCKLWFGLTEEHVSTQAGKSSHFIGPDGNEWLVRTAMQDVGRLFERHFGEYATPSATVRNLSPEGRYSFGSVRRTQAHFYKTFGALVVAVRRSGVEYDGNESEWFDPSAVDLWLDNPVSVEEPLSPDFLPELGLDRLKAALDHLLAPLL